MKFDLAYSGGMGKTLALYLALAIRFNGGLELAGRALEAAARKRPRSQRQPREAKDVDQDKLELHVRNLIDLPETEAPVVLRGNPIRARRAVLRAIRTGTPRPCRRS